MRNSSCMVSGANATRFLSAPAMMRKKESAGVGGGGDDDNDDDDVCYDDNSDGDGDEHYMSLGSIKLRVGREKGGQKGGDHAGCPCKQGVIFLHQRICV